MYHTSVQPEACPALVLNADFRPLSYYPLSLWSWQDAVKAVFLERVNIVSEYETVIHSPNHEFRLPSVVSLKTYVKPSRTPAFTRFNVFLRDKDGGTHMAQVQNDSGSPPPPRGAKVHMAFPAEHGVLLADTRTRS